MFADFHGHSHILGITLLGCDAAASEVKQDPVLHAATSSSRASQKFFADHSEAGTRVLVLIAVYLLLTESSLCITGKEKIFPVLLKSASPHLYHFRPDLFQVSEYKVRVAVCNLLCGC